MNYTVNCNCGKPLTVRASDAGTTKVCDCGADIQIPALSVLRASATNPEPTHEREHSEREDNAGWGVVVLYLITIILVVMAAIQSQASLIPIGMSMVFIGRLWFALLILREMTFGNALTVFFIPFMPTIFFFTRIDITWKPFVYGLLGYLIAFVGLSVVSAVLADLQS